MGRSRLAERRRAVTLFRALNPKEGLTLGRRVAGLGHTGFFFCLNISSYSYHLFVAVLPKRRLAPRENWEKIRREGWAKWGNWRVKRGRQKESRKKKEEETEGTTKKQKKVSDCEEERRRKRGEYLFRAAACLHPRPLED